jgi:hypothetical protein
MSDKLYDLIVRGVLIQGLIALALVAAIVYLSVTGQGVPEILVGLTGLAFGFYFGGEAQARVARNRV